MNRRKTTLLTGISLLLALLAAPGVAGAQNAVDRDARIAELLRGAGIRPVQPHPPATDFTLPDVRGREVTLSELGGRWVLLTFFATWCGPCATEMPSLQRLHDTFSKRGFEVLGVAVQPERDKVAAYARQKGLSFTVLVDGDGRVGSIYRAASIPTSYLVSPEGRLVGVARGARDWDGAGRLVEGLMELIAPGIEEDPAFASGTGPIELPSTLEPPEATVRLAPTQPVAGEPFELQVRINWAGTIEDYILLPPVVQLPEGVENLGTSAATSSSAGETVINYTLTFNAAQPGNYALDPVELRYTPRFESAPVSQRIAGATVAVQPFAILGLAPWLFALLLLLLVGGVPAGLLGVRFWRRAQLAKTTQGQAVAEHAGQFRSQLDDARAARLRGDAAAFLSSLDALYRTAAQEPPPDLADTLEAARYGGKAPGSHILEQMERNAARIVSDAEAEAEAKRAHEKPIALANNLSKRQQ